MSSLDNVSQSPVQIDQISEATSQQMVEGGGRNLRGLLRTPQFIIRLSIVWNFFFAAGSIFLSFAIFSMNDFYNLGDPVQIFLGHLALLPAFFALYGAALLRRGKPNGRFITMTLNYLGMVLAFVYLLHLWGFYLGLDAISEAIYENRVYVWGFALAYGVFWLAGRFSESSPIAIVGEKVGLGLAMLTLLVLLIAGDAIGAVGDIFESYGEARTWLVTIIVVICGFVGYGMLRLGEYFGETPEGRTAWQGWIMLSPNIIGFAIFFAGPLLLSFYLSFTYSPPGGTPELIGLDNYGDMLELQFEIQEDTSQPAQLVLSKGFVELETFNLGDERLVVGARDHLFWISLRNTIFYCLMLVPLSTIPALLLAMVLNSQLPGVKFYRAIYFLPSVAAVVGTAVIWREAMYSSTVGFVNYSINEIIESVNSITGADVKDFDMVWLTDARLVSLVIMSAWQIVGFNSVLFLAGLQGIPTSLYEAAQVDGANRLQQFWKITLPLLGPTTFFVVVTTIINGLQVFNEAYVMFNNPPPDDALTSVFHLYRSTFFGSNYGYASAIAWAVFLLIFVVTIIQFRVSRSNAYGD